MAEKKWTSDEVVNLLRERFNGDEYAVFEQVSNGTGGYSSSWIDVAVVGLWPSKGLTRSAFEVKVSRGDFLQELRNPNKNKWARDSFHSFWYVAPKGVIKDASELPENCGWMKVIKGGLRIERQARRLDNVEMNEHLFSSLARAAQKSVKGRVENARKEILTNDPSVVQAFVYQSACHTFFESRGVLRHPAGNSEDAIIAHLESATMDTKAREDRDHIESRLDLFQERMLAIFHEFCNLAHIGLTERDELGRFMNPNWGSYADDEGLGRVKENKNSKQARLRKVKAVEIIHKIGGPEE